MPQAETGLNAHGISRVAVLGWLVVFTGFEWLRFKLETFGIPSGIEDFIRGVSALECLEIALLARMIDWKAVQPRIGVGEAAATLFGLAFVVLFITGSGSPIFAAVLLSFYVLCRFGRSNQQRAIAIGGCPVFC